MGLIPEWLVQFYSTLYLVLVVVFVTSMVVFVLAVSYRCLRPRRVPFEPYVLVSGCDSGIGREAALALSLRGARVFAGFLKPHEVNKNSLPMSMEVLPLDVTSPESIRQAVETVERKLKAENEELWAVVNNAGVCVFGPFEWQTEQQVERQVNVNVLGTMNLTKAFIPLLKPLKGRIVTLTSVNGVLAYPGLSAYSASKFALEGFLRALRLELRPCGVEVVTVRPGDYARATNILAAHQSNAHEMWDALGPERREEITERRFWSYHESVVRNSGLTSPVTLRDSPILDDINSAVMDESVRSLYVSAPLTHRVVYSLLRSLPDSWSDRLLGNVYDKLSGGEKFPERPPRAPRNNGGRTVEEIFYPHGGPRPCL